MTTPFTIECAVHFHRGGRGYRKELNTGREPQPLPSQPGQVSRIARLMALALRFERLVDSGAIAGYAELARLGHVTRARISQIMNLLHLAPDIQEHLLFLARPERGRDPIPLRQLQRMTAVPEWRKQRSMWKKLLLNVF